MIIGPPVDRSMDCYVVNRFLNANGKKVVCGGTTAQIISRETGRKIVINLNYIDQNMPPTATIEGIDLATEGILTMSKALEYAKIKSVKTLRMWIDKGYIYGHKRSGTWIIDRQSIDDWYSSDKL